MSLTEHDVAFPRMVLVVEDDAGLRRLLMDVIATEPGITVDGADSVAEAEALLAAPDRRYDTILLDRGLPDGDGGELCLRLRQRGIDDPIIMLTGCVARGEAGRVPDFGASDYLAKPVGVAELMRRLRRQLELGEAARAGCLPGG